MALLGSAVIKSLKIAYITHRIKGSIREQEQATQKSIQKLEQAQKQRHEELERIRQKRNKITQDFERHAERSGTEAAADELSETSATSESVPSAKSVENDQADLTSLPTVHGSVFSKEPSETPSESVPNYESSKH